MTTLSVISDTHCTEHDLAPANIGIHCGDFSINGFRIELVRQLCWLETQRSKFTDAFAVLGNHDIYGENHLESVRKMFTDIGWKLLHNESYVLPNGLKIWGSSHTPNYHGWAFMLEEEDIKKVWDSIPADTSVVITHGPAQGILDVGYRGSIGCPWLRKRIAEIKPKAHLFGHAHPINFAPSTQLIDGTLFVNAATRNVKVEIQ